MTGSLHELAGRIGHRFGDEELLRTALRHRSWIAENDGHESNERLEFLGDAVLGWVVADLVYRRYDDLAEGKLTDLRKSVVNAIALGGMADRLGVGEREMGRGQGRSKKAAEQIAAEIACDELEAERRTR